MMASDKRMTKLWGAVAALVAALLLGFSLVPTGADAAKVDNPSPPNFRAEITGGFLEVKGSSGTSFGIPMDFSEFELPNPAIAGTITPNANGYGEINVPNNFFPNCVPAQTPPTGGICFPPVPVNIDDIAITIRILPLTNFTGTIDPLTGIVHMRMPIRLKAEGSAMNIPLGNNCYLGSSGSPIILDTKTHVFNQFPTTPQAPELPRAVADFVSDDLTGWISGEAYSDEPGVWPGAPTDVPGYTVGTTPRPTAEQILHNPLTDFVARSAGSWRGTDETWTAPKATDCGSSLVTDQLNSQVGLPANPPNNTAVIDFQFVQFPGRPNAADAIVKKAVKSRFVAAGTSSNPWPTTEKPTAVSAQEVTIDASSSYFKVGGHSTERYSFDLGTGNFGPWTTNPVASFVAPTIPEGADPVDMDIRVRVKDSQNDADVSTRTLQVVPATDISLDTEVSSVAGAKFRGGSAAEIGFDVTNESTSDANSLPLTLSASLPTGVTMTGFDGPGAWTCDNDASTISCTLPKSELPAGATSHFDVTVDVAANAPTPAEIEASVAMAGDPSPANNDGDVSVDVVKTDLTVAVDRPEELVANGWFPYEIDVTNVGDGLTVGGTTVAVTLPAEFTYRSQGSGGTGWTCSAPSNPQNVSCVLGDEIAGNASAPALTVWARVDKSTPAEDRTVDVSVSTQADIDAFGGANQDSDTGLVQVRTDLAMDVAIGGHYVVGDPGTIGYTVTNQSVVPGSEPTTVTSALPDGLTVSAVGGTGWDCSATVLDSDEISCTLAAGLGAGEASEPITATVDVAQAAYPGVSVPATLSNSQDAFAPNDEHVADVEVRRLDVAIEKLAVKSFNVGIEGRYRLNVANVGNAPPVGDVVVTDELPAGLTLNGVSGAGWDCSDSVIGGQSIHCELSSALGAGIQASPIEARVTVLDEAAEAGLVENTAYVDTERDDRSVPADAAITGNNTSTIQTSAVAVDLSIESNHQGAFLVGTEDLYSLTVRNIGFFGTDPGEPVTVTDFLPDGILPLTDQIEINRPDGWSCDEDAGDVTCTLEAPDALTSAMEPESTVTIDIPVTVTDAAADSSDNIAQVSTQRDSNPTLSPNNIATDPTTVRRVDLALSGSVSIAPRAGGIGEVTVGVENIGSAATAQPTVVEIPLAAGTSYRPTGSTTAGWSCSSAGAGTTIECVRSQSIAAGASAPPLKVRTNVTTAAPASWSTDASVSTNLEPSERLADNEISLTQDLEVIDLSIAKSHDPAATKAGTRATQKIHVTNVGNTASAATIRVEDSVPASFDNVTANGKGWNCAVTGNDVECTRTASVAAGAAAPDITVGFNIPGDQAGTRNSTAEVISSDDPYDGNDTAGDPIAIVAAADVAVTVNQPGHARVGDTVDMTYNVRNIGTDSTSGSPSVTLKITLSEGLSPVDEPGSGDWSCDVNPASDDSLASVNCDLVGELEPGEESTITGEFEVIPTSETTVDTLARVATPGEINKSNNVAIGSSSLSGVDLAASVDAPGDDFLVAGTTSNRVVTVTNDGTAATTGPIQVKVALPAGVAWDSNVNTGSWNCNQVGANLTCGIGGQLAPGDSLSPLTLGIRPSRSNAPSVQLSYVVSTVGDENPANDAAVREDVVRYHPDTTITSGPSGSTTSRNATVSFESDDSGATFECSVDGGAFNGCASPLDLTGLSVGEHTVGVRAVNEHGMADATPATIGWAVKAVEPVGPSIPVKAESVGGTLSLASLGSVDLPENQLTLNGRLYTDDGTLVVPASGVAFKPVVQELEMSPGVVATITISIVATGDAIGNLPNGGGPTTFVMPVRADVTAIVAGNPLLPEGTECSLKPVTFDFTGTYDEATGMANLEQPNVAFPQVTGCGSFKQLIDEQLELPRNDIQMEIQVKITKGSESCPDGQVGTPPDCAEPQGKAKLAKPVIKAPKKVKVGKAMTVRAKVKNAGDADAAKVKVCLATPKALVKGKAKRCKTIKKIAAGKTGVAKFKVKTKKTKKAKKGKKVKLKVTASGKGLKAVSRGHVTILK